MNRRDFIRSLATTKEHRKGKLNGARSLTEAYEIGVQRYIDRYGIDVWRVKRCNMPYARAAEVAIDGID